MLVYTRVQSRYQALSLVFFPCGGSLVLRLRRVNKYDITETVVVF